MAKVAKLVVASFITRVVVEDTATYEETVEAARQGIAAKVNNELFENIEDVIDDTEMPYDPNIELTPEEIAKLQK